jgi:hypothetical protein
LGLFDCTSLDKVWKSRRFFLFSARGPGTGEELAG